MLGFGFRLYIGIMEKKMVATIMGVYICIWVMLGLRKRKWKLLFWRYLQGVYWDHGKENGSYYNGGYIYIYMVVLG